MTKEEIMAMEAGRDLDVRVAEDVMGCKFVRDEIFGDIQIYDNGMWLALPPYSEDKSAALPVLERLKEHYGEKLSYATMHSVVPSLGSYIPHLSCSLKR